MPSRLIDCSQKAVKAGALTQEEADFIRGKAKELGGTRDAELAAVRSMVNDGIAQLRNIRNQLGKADPIKEAKILYRTTNKDAAMAAMVDETQAIVETTMLKEAQALQGDQGTILAAEQKAEEGILGETGRRPDAMAGVTTDEEVIARLKTAASGVRPELRAQVERTAGIEIAIERLNKKPDERVHVYQKMRDRVQQLMKENRIEIAGMEFARGMTSAELATAGLKRAPEQHEIQREKMLSAMGELNALLKFLPAEVRGKVGGFFQLAQGGVGEAELADFFTKRVQMIEREMERLLKADYLGQIKELLGKPTKPVKGENKIVKSKIGNAQVAADIAREAMAMDDVAAAQEVATLESAATNPDLTPDEQSEILYRQGIINLFGDIEHQSAEHMAAAHAWLKDTADRGRSEWGDTEERRLEEVRKWANEIKTGLPPVSQPGISAMARPPNMATWLNSFDLEHHSFAQFLAHVLPEGATVIKRWQKASRIADNATQDFIRNAGDRLTEHIKTALGTSSRMTVGRSIQFLKKEETLLTRPAPEGFYPTLVAEQLRMTRMDAAQYLLSWGQPKVRARMEKQGWTQATIQEMRELTSDEASQAAIEFLRDEYSKLYDLINPIYKRMNGMDMPRETMYAPTHYLHGGAEKELSPIGSPLSVNGVTPGFQIGRVNHNARLRQVDALTAFHQHMMQVGHWIHHAELVREMRGVFGDPDVRIALEQQFGQWIKADIDKWIDALARQGGNKAAEIGTVNVLLDAIIGGKAVASLGLNLRSVMNQIDSAIRVVAHLPPKRIIAAMTDPKFFETLPAAFNSDTVQRRIKGGSSPEARYLFDQTRMTPTQFLELARATMLPLQYADAYLTSFSAAVVYRDAYNDAIAHGMDETHAEEYALDLMDDAVYRFSQPTGLASKSLMEVSGNSLFRLFMMFQSDARLKSALLSESLRGLAKNPASAEHWRKLAAVQSFAIVSYLVRNLYNQLFTDTPDDELWTMKGLGLAIATAPLAGYLLAGTAVEVGIKAAMGEKVWAPARDPLSEAAFSIGPTLKHLDDLWNPDDTKKMLREWQHLSRVVAVAGPAPAILAATINAIKPVHGGIENAQKED